MRLSSLIGPNLSLGGRRVQSKLDARDRRTACLHSRDRRVKQRAKYIEHIKLTDVLGFLESIVVEIESLVTSNSTECS